MKRFGIIFAVALALLLGGVTAWHLVPRPLKATSELYRRYEHQPGVRVGFVSQMSLDDSTAVDVTTLQALDDHGWQWMRREFALDTYSAADSIGRVPAFAFRRMDRENPATMPPADSPDFDMLVVSPADSCVSIYHLATEAQHDKVVDLAFEKYLAIENL